MPYTKEQLALCEGATVPDLVGDDCRLLFVGINPGLQTAMTGIHFAHRSNRFWPALKRAGLIDQMPDLDPVAPAIHIRESLDRIEQRPRTAATQTHFADPGKKFYPALQRGGLVPYLVDVHTGMTDGVRQDLIGRGIGITNIVNRATARADELSRDEIRAGGEQLRAFVETWRPAVVAILGITTYRIAFSEPKAQRGPQPHGMGASELHVLGNPSGLNAHETIDSLAESFAELARLAAIDGGQSGRSRSKRSRVVE